MLANTARMAMASERILRLIQIQAEGHEILPNGKTSHISTLAMDHSQETGQPKPIEFIHLRQWRLLRALSGAGDLLSLSRLLLPLLQLFLWIAEIALSRHEGVAQILRRWSVRGLEVDRRSAYVFLLAQYAIRALTDG